MSNSLVSKQRTKHIDVRRRFLSQGVEDKKIAVEHVPGQEQVADLLTKPLPALRFINLRSRLMGLIALVLTMCAVVGAAPRSPFAEVPPIYYALTNIAYLRGVVTQHVTVDIINRCNNYFVNVTSDEVINQRLLADCDASFHAHTRIKLADVFLDRNYKTARGQTNRIKRSHGTSAVLSYFVHSGLKNYQVFSGEDSKTNVEELSKKLNSHSEVFVRAMVALNETRNTLKDLNARVMDNALAINYLNETLREFPKVMALVNSVGEYHTGGEPWTGQHWLVER